MTKPKPKRGSRRKTLLQLLDFWPPFLIFNIALKTSTTRVISSRCGIPERTLTRIGTSTSYWNLRVQTIDAFLEGCGIMLSSRGIICGKVLKERLKVVLRSRNGFPKMNRLQRKLFDERCRKLVAS